MHAKVHSLLKRKLPLRCMFSSQACSQKHVEGPALRWQCKHDKVLLNACLSTGGEVVICAGCVVFHRSGDAGVGAHGNSGLWRNSDSSHRVALVLYQTDLKASSRADSLPATSAVPEAHQNL